jgi:hypothetical protein
MTLRYPLPGAAIDIDIDGDAVEASRTSRCALTAAIEDVGGALV